MNRSLAAASDYAQRGLAVLPVFGPRPSGECSCRNSGCTRIGKHPRTEHGLYDATTDQSVINGWFAKWPDANVGIRTGGNGGFFAFDVDPRNGGLQSFQDLRKGRSLPPTVKVVTPGGGFHLYLSQMGLLLAGTTLAPGIDIKAEGGYVIAPPSLGRNGVGYSFEKGASHRDIGIADTPEWLLTLLPLSPSAVAPPPPLPSTARANSRSRHHLSERIGQLLRDGDLERRYHSRSEVVQAIATEAVGKGWTEEDLFVALRDRENRGGERVQELALAAARRDVALSWTKALIRVASSQASSSAEFLSRLELVEEQIAKASWSGNAGATDWAVAQALVGIAKRTSKLEFHAAAREVAELAGIGGRDTAAKSLKRLTEAGLIARVSPAVAGVPAVYRFVAGT